MAKWGELTPATIFQIVCEIREGKADPDDARRLLELFCDRSKNDIPPELTRHIQAAFSAYLAGEKTLESALGLARKKGRPKADEQTRQEMAADLLRCRLGGIAHQECLTVVTDKYGWGETIIGEAWAAHKQGALILLRLERPIDKYPWTPDEVHRLAEIFRGEPWFITSGKPANKAA